MTYFIVTRDGDIKQVTDGRLYARWSNWKELFWILTSPSVNIDEAFKVRYERIR